MSTICKEYDRRIQQEEVTGTCDWIKGKEWEERKVLTEHIENLSKENYTPKQSLILRFVLYLHTSVLKIKELEIDLKALDETDIRELIKFYDLEKPEARYQEIRAAIASPENYLTRIPYRVIRELHSRGKVPFDRQIFAACLIRFNVWHGASYSKDLDKGVKNIFHSVFPKDEFTIDILMAVFEMELGVERAFYLDSKFNIGAIIIELVNSGHITRNVIQQKLFDAFNNPTLKQNTHGWVKNIYRDLEFSLAENLACQEQLIQLMYNDRNLLVNYGLQELKKIGGDPSFDWPLFISSLDGIVYAEKLAGGLKTAIGILHKGLKKDNSLVESCCINLAPIFLQEDNKVQEMAAQKCFAFLTEPNEAVKEALLPFLDTMHSEVKSALQTLIGEEEIVISYDTYLQEAYCPKPCKDLASINYIDSEDDFIFLVSKVLKSNEALDYELFLEAITRYHSLKETHYKTLQPALKQAKKIAEEQYLDITARIGVHHTIVAKLICMWLSKTPCNIESEINEWKKKVKKEVKYEYTANRWFAIFNQFKRITYLINQLNQKEFLPLLSTPTHNNFEIDPNVFFERLNLYQEAKKAPDEDDFCMALCRMNSASSFDKIHLSNNTEHDKVITYLLNKGEPLNPKNINKLPLIWLTAYVIKNPDNAINTLLSFHKNKEWWNTSTKWDWNIYRRYSDDRKYSWAMLDFNFNIEEFRSLNSFNHSYFEHFLTNEEFIIADAEHWFSRNGSLQEPLYLNLILQVFRYSSDLEANETKSILEIVKYNAKHPKPLKKAGYLFLTLSLFCDKKTIRAGAFDWLSLLIENKYLDIDQFTNNTARMVAGEANSTPMPRVTEQLDRLLEMQGVYIDVLHQVIESCLGQIDLVHLPKGFSKILHRYFEVLQIIKNEIPHPIISKLEELSNLNSVKKEAKKLLAL